MVVLYVADLSHMEKVLGHVSCTAKFGCMRCKKLSCKWAHFEREVDSDGEVGHPISGKTILADMLLICTLAKYGAKAAKELGRNPRETVRLRLHYGQTAPLLLPS